jgi:hypothetical protein
VGPARGDAQRDIVLRVLFLASLTVSMRLDRGRSHRIPEVTALSRALLPMSTTHHSDITRTTERTRHFFCFIPLDIYKMSMPHHAVSQMSEGPFLIFGPSRLVHRSRTILLLYLSIVSGDLSQATVAVLGDRLLYDPWE